MASFVSTYKNKYLKKRIHALEHSEVENTTVITGIEAVSKNGEFEVATDFEVSNITELSEHINKGKAALLVITTDQVLTRQVTGEGSADELLAKGFPNLDLGSFYYEVCQTKETAFIAVCRKEYVDSLIVSYQVQGIFITDFALGNLCAAYVLPYMTASSIHTTTATLEIQEGEISDMIENPEGHRETYAFGEKTIASGHLLSLGMGLKSMGSSEVSTGNSAPEITELTTAYKEKRFFKTVLAGGVGVLLVALLVNFLVFSSTFKTSQKLKEDLQVYTAQKKQLETRMTAVKKKEAMVKSVLTIGFSKSSWYIDQVIQSQPETVLLETLTYQPLEKILRKGKPIEIIQNVLTVSGQSVLKEEFTAWLNTLENLDFVDNITIVSYGNTTSGGAAFEIRINMKRNDTEK